MLTTTLRMTLIAVLTLTAISRAQAPKDLEYQTTPAPEGTKITANFPTDAGRGPEVLLDGEGKTFLNSHPNQAGRVVSLYLRFPQPLNDLAGVRTGKSDPNHNYYPRQMRFYADTNGDGKYDTYLGQTEKLGPADQNENDQVFGRKVPVVHGLEIRVTRQNQAGVQRAFMMNQLSLLRAPGTWGDNLAEPADAKPAEAPAPPQAPAAAAGNRKLAPGQPVPTGTKIASTARTEQGKGADALIDGNPDTFIVHGGGTLTSPTQIVSITLRFPEALENLAGVGTGESDPFRNYFPKEMEFYVDSNGDGRFDTFVGRTRKLGPAADNVNEHKFDGRLPKAHGLEIRVIESGTAGGNRAFTMNSLGLLFDPAAAIVEATPDSHRVLFYRDRVPSGTTARVTVPTDDGKGAENLLDGDPQTFMAPRQGTAVRGQPVSIFLQFPGKVTDLAGLRVGQSDPFRNYVWQKMEVWADTTGDGQYDTLAGTFAGGNAGEKRFRDPVPSVHALELRVVEQTIQGANRAFHLAGIDGLIFVDSASETQMRFVAEDFEDLGSWRTWAHNDNTPPGERPYGGHVFLSGAHRPELAKHGVGVGIYRYNFKPGPARLWATRGKVNGIEAIIDKIEFFANPQGYDSTVGFELVDAKGRRFHLPGTPISGNDWQKYSVSLTPETVANLNTYDYPFKLVHVSIGSDKGGKGEVLLDNITFVGIVDRSRRVRIRPVYEGMGYNPDKPLVVKYRLWNSMPSDVSGPLVANLYASVDARSTTPLATQTVEVTIPAYGDVEVSVDFGKVAYGHYHAKLSLQADGIDAQATDPVAVLKFNGGRINTKPMWFGSMHPMGWIANVENEFVIRNVVVPLGLDAYRVGMPEQDNRVLLDTNLLFAAGFGHMPPHLRLPKQQNDHRGEPNDYDKYFDYIVEQATQRYLPFKDRIISVEFYNEPDLPNFEFHPEIDVYLKMHAVFTRAFRQVIPDVRIGTGGTTVQHGKEKKDFNSRMFIELAKVADVAIWHAHGALENYTQRHHMVENWLAEGGRAPDEMLLGNSEAGLPSGDTLLGHLRQADNLVKKVGWAKSQKNSLFYIWFTTTDTYDPQGGYLGGENWGLITYNQRLKPSGQAYNELIKRLANTTGLGEVELDSRLGACAYRRDDGTHMWMIFPREQGAKLMMRFSASGPITVSDMFGATRAVRPANGIVTIEGDGYPIYVEAPAGTDFGRADAPQFAAYEDQHGMAPGATLKLPVKLTNTWNADTVLNVAIQDDKGNAIVHQEVKLASGASETATLTHQIPEGTAYGTLGWALRVRSIAGPAVDETLPLTVVVAEMAVRVASVKIDGQLEQIPNAVPIVLDQPGDIQDMVYDPNTPNWAGAEDLSTKAIFAHDGKGLYIGIEVRDQTHKPGAVGEKLWDGDSVQIAFFAGSNHTEIGLTETDGGVGWQWISPDPKRIGKLDAPVVVKRHGDRTVYETYLSFESLGVQYTPGYPLRMTFLINEDDGRGRVRIARWFDGIAAAKSVDRFGHLVLE